MWIKPVELPHLAIGAPAKIALPGIAQMGVGGCLGAARIVEPGGELISDGFVLNEAVVAGCPNRPLVEAHRVEVAAFDPRDFGAYQCGTVFEILGAVLRPYCKLPMGIVQSFEVCLSRALACRIKSAGPGESAVKVMLRRFKIVIAVGKKSFGIQ